MNPHYKHQHQYGGTARGRTAASTDWLYGEFLRKEFEKEDNAMAALMNKIRIPPDAQLNTSIYEEAEVVYE